MRNMEHSSNTMLATTRGEGDMGVLFTASRVMGGALNRKFIYFFPSQLCTCILSVVDEGMFYGRFISHLQPSRFYVANAWSSANHPWCASL